MRIFCEGKDDKQFLIQLLRHLDTEGKLNSKPEYTKYIKSFGGKTKLLKDENYSAESKQIESGKIKKVLFIFDADFEEDNKTHNGLEKSEQCIENLIQELSWDVETDYYIFDRNLDDFIIYTLENKTELEACETCFNLKEVNKNRKILTCIYNKLYPKQPYDFSHENFTPLKQKLINLFTP